MARKTGDTNKDPLRFPEHIFGEYACTYTTYGETPIVTCALEIRRVKGNKEEYRFVWSIEGVKGRRTKLFEGIGKRAENRIDVKYSDV